MSYVYKFVENIFRSEKLPAILRNITITSMVKRKDIVPEVDGDIAKDTFELKKSGSVYMGLNNSVMSEPYAYSFSSPCNYNFGKKFNELIDSNNRKEINFLRRKLDTPTDMAYVHYLNYHPDGDQTWIPKFGDNELLGLLVIMSGEKEPDPNNIIGVFIPKNFAVTIHRGTWHCPPFAVKKNGLNTGYTRILNMQAKTHYCVGYNMFKNGKEGICIEVPDLLINTKLIEQKL